MVPEELVTLPKFLLHMPKFKALPQLGGSAQQRAHGIQVYGQGPQKHLHMQWGRETNQPSHVNFYANLMGCMCDYCRNQLE